MISFLRGFFSRRHLVGGFWFFLVATLVLVFLDWRAIRKDGLDQIRSVDSTRTVTVSRVHDSLMRAKEIVEELGAELSIALDAATLDSIDRRIERLLERHPCVYGAGVALDPTWIKRHPGAIRRSSVNAYGQWSSYVLRRKGGSKSVTSVEYDYTDTSLEAARWYSKTVRVLGPTWVGPYFSATAQTNLIAYSRPLFGPDHAFIGVVRAVYSLADLRNKVALANIRDEGYSILVSNTGAILYHPRMELMDGKSTLRSIGEKTGNVALLTFSDSLDKASASGAIPYRSIFTGETASLKYTRIRDVGWYMISIIPDSGSKPFCTYQKHVSLFLLALVILSCWGWCLLWRRRLWVASIGVSSIFSVGIVLICWLVVAKFESGVCTPLSVLVKSGTLERDPAVDCSRTPLSNAFAASAFMNRCFELDSEIHSIPTGILLQTVNFTSAYSFSVSGYVWQKYHSREDSALLGVEFPENESVSLEDAYDDSIAPTEFVRGWRFSASIRQPFDYRQYPLDREEIWIRMQPKGLNQKLMLEPDFNSYGGHGTGLFGIDQNLVLPQWKIMATNFSYAKNASTSNYGRGEYRNRGEQPELYFSLHVRRNIFDAFISQFIPLLVIILMLFSILWVGRKKDEPGLLGFNALSGASGCSAVFFIVIFSHISTRNMLGSPGVVYMECYYFVTYAAILFVSLNSILVAMDDKSKFINLGDNLISRLIYWPLVTGILFVWTFVTFF